ncbi:trehalose 6-phosphate phosphorylase [Weissella uvarum]|uniref:glycoside hydrolase family 65 protein n=1 Tax=Weissella uvarum TaxID=1479233 RepID=UPI00195FE523|nr:glycoside hydrolase family 65 protein [Weissella uvarum]MBM7616549.1 trehalose 6-phosphate phosphorylase [Weissella uvarum]MCM0594991.1 glycoside hydrolase family 65 protein [Weissella uvarum]
MQATDWQLHYDTIAQTEKAYGREALLTLGNGYMGWRGAPVWTKQTDNHYPGLYVAGIFNQTATPVAGRDVINEDLVNLPNPQYLRIVVDGQVLDETNLVEQESTLAFDSGQLHERDVFQIKAGHIWIDTTKVINHFDWHQAGFKLNLSADFKASIELISLIDTTTINANVKRYRDFVSHEYDVLSIDPDEQSVWIKTKQSALTIGIGAKTTLKQQSQYIDKQVMAEGNGLAETFAATLVPGVPLELEKQFAIVTSQETGLDLPRALQAHMQDNQFELIKAASQQYWSKVWEDADIQVDTADERTQQLVRLNIFHLHQLAQKYANPQLDVSVGSRGLTGEGYRGHIFWDELFLIPYYAANEPETAKALLQYRIRRLSAAQANASKEDEVGAMYPWQSGLYGDEQAQIIHLNTIDNSWIPDNSRLQRHVSLAVIYNLWVYTKITGDTTLLNEGGLMMTLEVAKFWLNKVEQGTDGRFNLNGVMGPDEFHEGYPDAQTGGVKNNAYTNVMLAWMLAWIGELSEDFEPFQAIAAADAFNQALLAKAEQVAQQLNLEIDAAGVIAQFDGYFDLERLDLAAYREKYGDIHRVDRLLKAEGKSPDAYQVAKQTDLLMLLYNFDATQVQQLLTQLGYAPAEDWLQKNKDYYLARTVHGSTTSRPVFAGIDVTLGNLDEANTFLMEALRSDVDDIQGGTTAEGIHTGVMGETLSVIQNHFAGVSLTQDILAVDPHLPKNWCSVHFKQRYQGQLLDLYINQQQVRITTDGPLQIKVQSKVYDVDEMQPLQVQLEG